jgi:hypothetical protein
VSLGIAFKGAEGIVLAADSRVTLTTLLAPQVPQVVNQPPMVLPSTFDNATKLLSVDGQKFVGAVTFGVGAIGQQAPRTAASFMPEFEEELAKHTVKNKKDRMSVEDFAEKLGEFFLDQWTKGNMPNPVPPGNEMVFLVGGYNEKEPYGRVFSLTVPTAPKPVEQSPNLFGATWGGQRELVDRLIQGFDPMLTRHVQDILKISAQQRQTDEALADELKKKLLLPIPWQFLPLQDCVDLCIFLVRTTIQLQKWLVSVRGVGGAIDVATITRTGGFKAVQIKEVKGDTFSPMQ